MDGRSVLRGSNSLRFKVLTFDGVLCAAKTENTPHGDTSYDDSTYRERHSSMYF